MACANENGGTIELPTQMQECKRFSITLCYIGKLRTLERKIGGLHSVLHPRTKNGSSSEVFFSKEGELRREVREAAGTISQRYLGRPRWSLPNSRRNASATSRPNSCLEDVLRPMASAIVAVHCFWMRYSPLQLLVSLALESKGLPNNPEDTITPAPASAPKRSATQIRQLGWPRPPLRRACDHGRA